MADSAAYPPGSRAIKIPLHFNNAYNTPSRHRRGSHSLKGLGRTDGSDAGPSSSIGSDQDSSSWSSSYYSHTPSEAKDLRSQPSIASLSQKDPRLPAALSGALRKDKHKATSSMNASNSPPSHFPQNSPLGPSMLSSSSYKSINLSSNHDDPDEPPRLITYTKHSQGFTWNDELFLPSYLLGRYGGTAGGGRKKQYDADFGDEDTCPVTEIFVTDEEAEAMMP